MHTVHLCGDKTQHGCSTHSEGQSCQQAPHAELSMGRGPDWKETLSLTCGGRHWVPTVQGFWQGRKERGPC